MVRHILEAFLNGDPSLLWGALGALGGGAWGEFKDKLKEWTGKDSVDEWLNELKEDWIPDATTWERIREDIEEALENVQTAGEEVFNDIGETIEEILGTGQVEPGGDGQLGETRDIWTPEDDSVPSMEGGEFPGIGPQGAGGYSSDGGGGGGSGGTTPLGETSPPSSDAPSGSTPPPTPEDLGLSPDSGAYIEYQPTDGQVKITYPDGTQEVRPWP